MNGQKTRIAGLAICASLLASATAAQSPRENLLVSAAVLASRLNDPNLVLLHVGDRTGYDAGHIAGARFVTLADLSVGGADAGGLTLQMLPPATLRDRLAALGISDTSRIVVYYATTQITPATRVMLTLDYAGFGDRSMMLDGGMTAWTRDGRTLTAEVPASRTGTLGALKINPILVDAALVKSDLKSERVSIVDARLTSFYDGAQTGGSQAVPHKTGHIDGAKSVPWSDLTNEQQAFRSEAELRDRFARAGVKPGDSVIAYCHIGQQATAVVFAARLLGIPVRLYDGSFEDWSKQPDAPVTIKK